MSYEMRSLAQLDFVPSRIPRGAAIVRFSLLKCAAKFLIS